MGQRTAALFSFLTAAASFAVGNAVQASAMTEALRPAGAGFIVPLLLPIAAYALGHSGALRDRTLSVLTPLMAVFYLGGAWYVTMRSADGIPAAIGAIFREALTPRAAIAGLTKGLMSHEAGLGTAALAHSDGAGKPVDGAIEVAADTFLVSTATAMMLLATGGRTPLAALSCLPFARGFLTAAVLLFAFSSVLSWQSYGEKCAEHLGIDRRTYDIVFCVCLAPFSLAPLASAAAVSDIVNIILAAVNVTAMAKWALKKRRS